LIPDNNRSSELRAAVTIVRSALEKGIDAYNIRQYIRDAGDIEVDGNPISDAMFQGVLAIAIQQIQSETDTREFSAKRARTEAYNLAQAIAQACLVGGDVREANKAVSNMIAVIATRPAPKQSSPKDVKPPRNSIPDMSNEELLGIMEKRKSGEEEG
jgi:hypothetical protein